jgi:hypothetical protein
MEGPLPMLFDRSGSGWPTRPGTPIGSPSDLRNLLQQLITGPARIFDIVCPAGATLQFGAGGEFAFAQFFESSADAEPNNAAWVARPRSTRAHTQVEFDTADTPTPVQPEYCISPEELIQIADFFLAKNDRYPDVKWERLY